MAIGIRKAALCCVGKLTALWCTCVDNEDDDSKGRRVLFISSICILKRSSKRSVVCETLILFVILKTCKSWYLDCLINNPNTFVNGQHLLECCDCWPCIFHFLLLKICSAEAYVTVLYTQVCCGVCITVQLMWNVSLHDCTYLLILAASKLYINFVSVTN